MMEEEWHVSDSEDEEYMLRNTSAKLGEFNSLSVSLREPETPCEEHHMDYMPRDLTVLYEKIAKEGYISLKCQGSARPIENVEAETTNISADQPVQMYEDESSPEEKRAVKSKSSNTALFDFEEEFLESTVMFPRRDKKPSANKCKRTKRVGTMANVINDLSRFGELNVQAAVKLTSKQNHNPP